VVTVAPARLRFAQRALGLGVWLWIAALLLAPAALFPAGAFICHQRPERSFFVSGSQLPVCARCFGLYVGAACAVPLALVLASPLAGSRARALAVIAALPTAVTWTLEFAKLASFSNPTRFVAALPLGFAAAWLVLGVLSED
jgi:uncharacterized membrane protein